MAVALLLDGLINKGTQAVTMRKAGRELNPSQKPPDWPPTPYESVEILLNSVVVQNVPNVSAQIPQYTNGRLIYSGLAS